MSKSKAKGKVDMRTPRPGKRLGVKIFGGQKVSTGEIIIRQRGSTYHPSVGTKMTRDYTIFALRSGIVKFGKKQGKKIVSVM